MHASTLLYTKPYQLTVGQAQTGDQNIGLLTEPNDAIHKRICYPTISPFASIGARSLRLLTWASSSRSLLLYSIKQTRNESKYCLSESDVPLYHIIKVFDIIRCILFTPMDDPQHVLKSSSGIKMFIR